MRKTVAAGRGRRPDAAAGPLPAADGRRDVSPDAAPGRDGAADHAARAAGGPVAVQPVPERAAPAAAHAVAVLAAVPQPVSEPHTQHDDIRQRVDGGRGGRGRSAKRRAGRRERRVAARQEVAVGRRGRGRGGRRRRRRRRRRPRRVTAARVAQDQRQADGRLETLLTRRRLFRVLSRGRWWRESLRAKWGVGET